MSDLTRRNFIKSSGALGVLGASQSLFPSWMPRMAFRNQIESETPGDILVNIFLRGGMDGLSAVVPYSEEGAFYDNRPTQSVTAPGSGYGAAIDLDGRFGLHPNLAPLKEIYDDGDLAIVHATGLTDSTRSHFDAMQYMEYGIPGDKTIGTGWIGRHLQTAAWQNNSPFRAIGMGLMVPASLRGPVTPLAVRSITDFHFKGREDEARRLQQALSMLYTTDAPGAAPELVSQQAGLVFETLEMLTDLSPDSYTPANGAAYDYEVEFATGLQQVAQLIKADVGLEVASLDLGGWDTHEYQGTLEGEFNELIGILGRGLAAFYADLGERVNSVTVVVMSEFGRTLVENGSAGTDHGHGNVMFLMGGGVRGRQVFTDWPGLQPEALSDGDLAITTDYRDVLAEVVTRRLLNPAVADVFPRFSPSGLGLVEARNG